MKKILVFITLLIIPTIIMAEECSNEELVRLKTLASKVEVHLIPNERTYEYSDPDTGEIMTGKKTDFVYRIDNISKELAFYGINSYDKTVDIDSYSNYSENYYEYYIDSNYEDIQNYVLYISAALNSSCSETKLRTIETIVPRYNPFYNNSECKGLDDLYICQEFIYQPQTQVNFLDVVKKYKDKEIDNNGKKIEKKSFYELLIDFVEDNYIILIIILLLILGGVGYSVYRRNKRLKQHFN